MKYLLSVFGWVMLCIILQYIAVCLILSVIHMQLVYDLTDITWWFEYYVIQFAFTVIFAVNMVLREEEITIK